MSNMSFHYDVSGFVRREGIRMSRTVVRKNESLEDALRRFKRSVSKLVRYKKQESANSMKSLA